VGEENALPLSPLHGPARGSLLSRWRDRLVSVHLSDNDGEKDRHWLPGRGIIDWDLVASLFPAETISGCLSLEVYPDENETPPDAASFLERAHRQIVWFRQKVIDRRESAR
jgi:sugar phosphate isomerase/epimerase